MPKEHYRGEPLELSNQHLQDTINGAYILIADIEETLRIPRNYRGDHTFLLKRLKSLVQECGSFINAA